MIMVQIVGKGKVPHEFRASLVGGIKSFTSDEKIVLQIISVDTQILYEEKPRMVNGVYIKVNGVEQPSGNFQQFLRNLISESATPNVIGASF